MTRRQRLVRLGVSWSLVGVGVPLLVRADLGVAPFDVLNSGLSEALGWSFGLCFVIASIAFFGVGRLLGARLGWPCLAGTVVIGVMVNLVLRVLHEQHSLGPQIGYLVAGVLVIAVAICLVVSTEMGPGPTEVVMLGLAHRGLGIATARWIADGTPLVVGAALGGSIGPGTVVFAVGMAPMVRIGLRVLGYSPSASVSADSVSADSVSLVPDSPSPTND